MEGIINPSTELLYVTYYPISHTDFRVTVDLEWLLMKDFLFDPCQAFCHAISTTPWELLPSNCRQRGSRNAANLNIFLKCLGPDSTKISGVISILRPQYGSLRRRPMELCSPLSHSQNQVRSVFGCMCDQESSCLHIARSLGSNGEGIYEWCFSGAKTFFHISSSMMQSFLRQPAVVSQKKAKSYLSGWPV